MDSIGKRIRAFRRAKGWTQEELAQRAGTAFRYISALETDRADNPGSELLQRLASALEVPVSELLGETDEIAGPLPAAKLRGWGVSDGEIAQYSAVWPYWSRKQRVKFLGDLELIRLARADVQAMTDEVQTKVRSLENKAHQDDDPDPAAQPFAGQVAM